MPKAGAKSIRIKIPAEIRVPAEPEEPIEILQFEDATLTVWNGARFISWQSYVWEQLRKHYPQPERTAENFVSVPDSEEPPF